MTKINWILALRNNLHEDEWANVITGLRLNPILWDSLKVPRFQEKAILNNEIESKIYTPASLSLIFLRFQHDPKNLPFNFDEKYFPNKLAKENEIGLDVYENLKLLPIRDITSAGRIAIALSKVVDFNILFEQLKKILILDYQFAKIVISGLLGIITHPDSLITKLLSLADLSEWSECLIQAYLSAFLGCKEIESRLINIFQNLSLKKQLHCIRFLALHHPTIAAKVIDYIPLKSKYEGMVPNISAFRDLNDFLFNIEIANCGLDFDTSKFLLEESLNLSKRLQAEISFQLAQMIKRKTNHSKEELIDQSIPLLKSAFKLAPNNAIYFAGLVADLVEVNRTDEAQAWLEAFPHPSNHPAILLANAKIAIKKGYQNKALDFANSALDEITNSEQETISQISYELSKIFLDLQHPVNAIKSITISLHQQPINPTYLLQSASCWQAMKKYERALEDAATAMAVGLSNNLFIPNYQPINMLQQEYLNALEMSDNWHQVYLEQERLVNNQANNNQDQYKLAKAMIRSEHDRFEETKIINVLSQLSQDSQNLSLLGEAYLKIGDATSAIGVLKKACEQNPNEEKNWMLLAKALLRAGKNDDAIYILLNSLRIFPDSADLHLALGKTYLNTGSPQNAIDHLLITYNLYNDSIKTKLPDATTLNVESEKHKAEISYLTSKAYYLNRDIPKTITALEQAISHLYEGIEENFDIYLSYAHALVEDQSWSDSIPILEALIEVNPDQLELFLYLAKAYLAEPEQPNGAEQSIRLLNYVLGRSQDNELINQAQAILAEALSLAGDLRRAKVYFQRSLSSPLAHSPEWHSKLAFGLGKVNYLLNNHEAALTALQEAINYDPQNPDLFRWLSDIYLAANFPEEAFQNACLAVQIQPIRFSTISWFCDQCIKLHRKISPSRIQVIPEGIHFVIKYIQTVQENLILWLKLGHLHLFNNDLKASLAAFERLLKIQRTDYDGIFEQITILFEAGKTLKNFQFIENAIPFLVQSKELVTRLFREFPVETQGLDKKDYLKIFNELASLFTQLNKVDEAIGILKEAVEFEPVIPDPYLWLGDFLVECELWNDALGCFEKAYQLSPTDVEILQRIVYVYCYLGQLTDGLKIALNAINSENSLNITSGKEILINLAAEIASALLQNNTASRILSIGNSNIHETRDINRICLFYEVSLEEKNINLVRNGIDLCNQINPGHPRVQTFKIRLNNNPQQSIHFILPFDNDFDPISIWEKYGIEKFSFKKISYSEWFSSIGLLRSLIEASLALYQWEKCYYLLQQLIHLSPYEPSAYLLLAKWYVIRAEKYKFCKVINSTFGIPPESSIDNDTFDDFKKVIEILLRRTTDLVIEDENNDQQLNHPLMDLIFYWRDRGYLAFKPNKQTIETFMLRSLNYDEQLCISLAFRSTHDTNIHLAGDATDKISILFLLNRIIAKELIKPWEALESCCLAVEEMRKIQREKNQNLDGSIFAIIYYLFARVTFDTGNRNRLEISAQESILSALEYNPDEPEWHAFAGEIFYNLSENHKESEYLNLAKQHLEKAIELNANNPYSYLVLGKVLMLKGETNQAIVTLEKACQISPDLLEAWLILAKYHYQNFNLEKATYYVDHVIDKANDNIEAILLRGEIALHSGNPRGAQSRAQIILKMSPDHLEALQLLARALNAQGRFTEALRVMDKIIPQVEKPLPFELERARMLPKTVAPSDAAQELSLLAEKYPKEPIFKALLAEVLLEENKVDLALQAAHQALHDGELGLSPEEKSRLHLLLGRHFRLTGQLDGAIHHLLLANELTPTQPEILIEIGRTHQDRRQYTVALEFFNRAIQVAPKDPRAYYFSGLVYKEMKDYIKAEEMLKRAANLAPQDISIRRQLGSVVALNIIHSPRITHNTSPKT